MVQILQGQRKPTFAEQIAPAIESGVDTYQKLKGQQAQVDAANKLGIDPSILKLPKEAQAALFKNMFAKDKPLNALQESQKAFTDAKLRDLEQTQDFERRLTGRSNNETPDVSQDELDYLEGFAGQPGKRGVLGNIAKQKREKIENEKKAEATKFEADRKFHTATSKPIIEAANETIKGYQIKKGLRGQQRRDVASGKTAGIFPYMVDKMGLTSFRNPESARFTNEVKNQFVSSINDIPGARPNQFLERVLSTAQPMIGDSPEAALSILDLDDFVDDVKFKQAELELEIAKEDRKNLGYVKEDVSERARDRMGDYVNRRQEQMALTIQKRKEDKGGHHLL